MCIYIKNTCPLKFFWRFHTNVIKLKYICADSKSVVASRKYSYTLVKDQCVKNFFLSKNCMITNYIFVSSASKLHIRKCFIRKINILEKLIKYLQKTAN